MITKLTLRHEELIVFYQQKWKAIYLSTARLDRNRVLKALEAIFETYPESSTMPEVIFFESPYAAFNAQLRVATVNFNKMDSDRIFNEVTNLMTLIGEGQSRTDLWFNLYMDLSSGMNSKRVAFEVWEILKANLVDRVGSRIYEQVWKSLWNWLEDKLQIELKDTPEASRHFCNSFIDPDSEWASYAGLFDFCIHELDYSCDEEQWNLYQAMCRDCTYWFLPSSQYYIVCDRPTKILLNDRGQLHGEEEPAIQFIDGFGLYAKQGKISSICFPQT